MKTSKYSNLIRAIALFLVAITLLGTISFAANGWPSVTNPDNNSGDVDNNNDNADNDNNNTDNTPPQTPPIYIPQYVSYLTGLEISEAEYFIKPMCFSVNPIGPLYGISSAEAAIEIPVEDGQTRMLTYINSKKLPGKIGAITPTRQYINNIAKYLGGVLIANGNDDSVNYNGFDINGSSFDLSQNSEYRYTGYTNYAYTNNDLITAGVINTGLASYTGAKDNMPYKFTEFGSGSVTGDLNAVNIKIAFSQKNTTELVYSNGNEKYTLSKSGELKKDMLNDTAVEFDNIFVLFADATTYENSSASQMVLDTVSGGVGKYFTKGTCMDISWSVDASGNLTFTDSDSQVLSVNRGTSYISYMKSSRMQDLTIN